MTVLDSIISAISSPTAVTVILIISVLCILGISVINFFAGGVPFIGTLTNGILMFWTLLAFAFGEAESGLWLPMVGALVSCVGSIAFTTALGEDTLGLGWSVLWINLVLAIVTVDLAVLSIAGFKLLETPFILGITMFFFIAISLIPIGGGILAVVQFFVILFLQNWVSEIFVGGAPIANVVLAIMYVLIISAFINILLAIRVYNPFSWGRWINVAVYPILAVLYAIFVFSGAYGTIAGALGVISIFGVLGIAKKKDKLPSKVFNVKGHKYCLFDIENCEFDE